MSTPQERSTSRGRELHSTGRGGLGNFRSSLSQDRPTDGPDDFSPTRGRELPIHDPQAVRSTGRGGAGNFRSPSRDVGPTDAEYLKEHHVTDPEAPRSFGRGGLGNMSSSRSRSKDPTVQRSYSTGRGGIGNLVQGQPSPGIEEPHRGRDDTVHSTGRGGFANLTSSPSPRVERPAHIPGEYESSGRGGAGNIRSSSRSASRGPRGDGDKEKHGLSGFLHKVAHPLGGKQSNSVPPHVPNAKEGAAPGTDHSGLVVMPGEARHVGL